MSMSLHVTTMVVSTSLALQVGPLLLGHPGWFGVTLTLLSYSSVGRLEFGAAESRSLVLETDEGPRKIALS